MADGVHAGSEKVLVSGAAVPSPNNNNMFHYSNGGTSPQRKFPRKHAVDVVFNDVCYSTKTWNILNPVPQKKNILHGVSGHFRAGELTAIMGPSGAGKSTLLNVLAGYTLHGCEGRVLLNGKQRTARNRQQLASLSCYIQQEDWLRSGLTPLEAMTVAAHLKLGGSRRDEWKEQIKELLSMLGLSSCQDTRTSRLSGGQKKRLSVALELISNPPIIFLDEPTTGLDSMSCSQCVSLLKLLAQEGRTVICTIHQPSALLFEMFDQLYALSRGCCVYQGSSQELIPFLASLGLQCPSFHNPADFLMDVSMGEYGADIETLTKAADSNARAIKGTCEGMEMQTTIKGNHVLAAPEKQQATNTPAKSQGASLFMQFLLLYMRNLVLLRRNYQLTLIRLLTNILIGILFGYLYRNCGHGADTIYANYVYMYGTVVLLQYTGKMSVTLSFPLEMKTLRREHFNRWYSFGPYFFSFLMIEIPVQVLTSACYLIISYVLTGQPLEADRMLLFFALAIASSLTALATGLLVGCLFPTKAAVFIGPTILVLLSMFGFNIFKRDVPDILIWIYHISYFRAALHGMVNTIYVLRRPELPCPEDMIYCHYKYPSKFLSDVDILDVDVPSNMAMICGMGLLLYSMAALSVWLRLTRR